MLVSLNPPQTHNFLKVAKQHRLSCALPPIKVMHKAQRTRLRDPSSAAVDGGQLPLDSPELQSGCHWMLPLRSEVWFLWLLDDGCAVGAPFLMTQYGMLLSPAPQLQP